MTRVEINKLGFRAGEQWLFRNLSLDIPAGSFVAVVGASGAGKSSFLSCLAGMRPAAEGSVRFHWREGGQSSPDEARRRLGIIFQRFLLSENATVLTNVLCGRLQRYSFWRTLCGFPEADRREAFAILHDLGLAEYVHRPAGRVSGGEQQRIAVARALFQQPDLFLADEPVSQLDVYLTGRVLGLLKQQAMEFGRTVFCVLHDPELVKHWADYSLGLNRGEPENWHFREVNRKSKALV